MDIPLTVAKAAWRDKSLIYVSPIYGPFAGRPQLALIRFKHYKDFWRLLGNVVEVSVAGLVFKTQESKVSTFCFKELRGYS